MRNEFKGAPSEYMVYALYEAGLLSDNFGSEEVADCLATDMSMDMCEGYMVDHGTFSAMADMDESFKLDYMNTMLYLED